MNNQQQIVAVKSTLAGVAGWYVSKQLGFGASAGRLGLGVAALNIVSYIGTGHTNADSWITPRQRLSTTYNALKSRLWRMASCHLLWGAILLLGGASPRSTYLGWAIRRGPVSAASALSKICIFGPIAQEIVFRGFVQEKIGDIQHALRTPGVAADWRAERRYRVLTQVAVAVLVHINGAGRMHAGSVLACGMMAYGLGWIKEEHGIHGAMMTHSATSAVGALRTVIIGC